MKWLPYALAGTILSVCITSYAENITKYLTQENSAVVLTLQKEDIAFINFDLERYPIFRQSEWFVYVLKCESSEKSKISYIFNTQVKIAYSKVMLSSGESDGQLACQRNDGRWCRDNQIDTTGVLQIVNISGRENHLQCKLYPKIGE